MEDALAGAGAVGASPEPHSDDVLREVFGALRRSFDHTRTEMVVVGDPNNDDAPAFAVEVTTKRFLPKHVLVVPAADDKRSRERCAASGSGPDRGQGPPRTCARASGASFP